MEDWQENTSGLSSLNEQQILDWFEPTWMSYNTYNTKYQVVSIFSETLMIFFIKIKLEA